MLPETILHGLEELYAVHALWLSLGEDEAREGGFELLATWSVGHASEALRWVSNDSARRDVSRCFRMGTSSWNT
jgi:hypothetical protein